MKQVDVLFLYETRVRELENICLLKHELERRGYTVAVLNTWNELGKKKRPPYDPKVVVTHAMYHDGIYEFVCSLLGKVPKVVNLQWEQIGTVGEKESGDSRYVLKGVAAQVMNICWGDETVARLTEKSGIDPMYLRKTGSITLDFCRPELRKYYLSREELFARYGLPTDKQVNLFISSFAYVNLPPEIVAESDTSNKNEFIHLSVESFHKVLDWFERMLADTTDSILLYRPHPAEAENPDLLAMCERHPDRFFVIREQSVKQWIATCDQVYTWYSTAAAEVRAFGVPLAILRPHPLPRHREVEVFEGASFLTDYDAFLRSVQEGVTDGLCTEVFDRYYDREERMSYLRVADAIEEVLSDNRYRIHYTSSAPKPSLYQRVKQAVWQMVNAVANRLPENIHLVDKYRTDDTVSDYTRQLQLANYASDEEIEAIQSTLGTLLELAEKEV
ncbi:MAG: hypothetical protein IKU51_02780 [Clostridia bacterium]|nr:hypothetical protein [Clostridia bacterium]